MIRRLIDWLLGRRPDRWTPTARNAVMTHVYGATFGSPRFRR